MYQMNQTDLFLSNGQHFRIALGRQQIIDRLAGFEHLVIFLDYRQVSQVLRVQRHEPAFGRERHLLQQLKREKLQVKCKFRIQMYLPDMRRPVELLEPGSSFMRVGIDPGFVADGQTAVRMEWVEEIHIVQLDFQRQPAHDGCQVQEESVAGHEV